MSKKSWIFVTGLAVFLLAYGLYNSYSRLAAKRSLDYWEEKLGEGENFDFKAENFEYNFPSSFEFSNVEVTSQLPPTGSTERLMARQLIINLSYLSPFTESVYVEDIILNGPRFKTEDPAFLYRLLSFGSGVKGRPLVKVESGTLKSDTGILSRFSQVPFESFVFRAEKAADSYRLEIENMRLGPGNISGVFFYNSASNELKVRDFYGNLLPSKTLESFLAGSGVDLKIPGRLVEKLRLEKGRLSPQKIESRGEVQLADFGDSFEFEVKTLKSKFAMVSSAEEGLRLQLDEPLLNDFRLPVELVLTGRAGERKYRVGVKESRLDAWRKILADLFGTGEAFASSLSGVVPRSSFVVSPGSDDPVDSGLTQVKSVAWKSEIGTAVEGESVPVQIQESGLRFPPVNLVRGNGKLRFQGRAGDLFSADTAQYYFKLKGDSWPPARLGSLFPDSISRRFFSRLHGSFDFELEYDGIPAKFTINGAINSGSVAYDSYSFEVENSAVSFKNDELTMDSLRGQFLDGDFDFKFETGGSDYQLRGRIRGVDLRKPFRQLDLNLFDSGRLSARVDLSGNVENPLKFEGDFSLYGWDLVFVRSRPGEILAEAWAEVAAILEELVDPDSSDILPPELTLGKRSRLLTARGGMKLDGRTLRLDELEVETDYEMVKVNGIYDLESKKLNLELKPRLKQSLVDEIDDLLVQQLLDEELPTLRVEGEPGSFNEVEPGKFRRETRRILQQRLEKAVEELPSRIFQGIL